MKKLAFLFLLCFIISLYTSAQRPKVKFGDVTAAELQKKVYGLDSNANAVVLYDYCTAKYEGDNKSDFNVLYKFHKRIKLLNKNAFDLATVTIGLYNGNQMEEKVEKLEAVTYTLENGVVVTHKLDKSSIFKDKLSNKYNVQKFTLPNLSEGCIIEYSYTLVSPFSRDLKDWYFQGGNPVLWSEYDVTIPSVFNFITLRQGYQPFVIDTVSVSSDTYNILIPGSTAAERSEVVNFKTNTYHSTWAMQNLPALKREDFTTTLQNHVAKIEFQLASLRYPNSPERPFMRTWPQVAEELMKSESFGADLNGRNGWMTDEINKIVGSEKSDLGKAKKVFAYIRDNFKCTDYSATILSASIKKIFQAKAGNVADINILLTAMLKHMNYEAFPALLSTKDHGISYEAYPILSKFNYVICKLTLDTTSYLLDASQSKIGFGKLPEECYNGSARIISSVPLLIPLSASSLKEEKLTSVTLNKDEKGGLSGFLATNLGYYESTDLREKLIKTSQADYFKDIQKGYSAETIVENGEIENLNELEETVLIKYGLKLSNFEEDIVYFNPMMAEAYKTNPFKSAQRYYPVEMPYASKETYLLNLEIPDGYKVEELPKSVRVNYNEDEGKFEYIISQSKTHVQMRCTIIMNKAFFLPDEYENLRSFYAYIVKKQGEQIVFKKIK
jgi:hypothetical protein